MKNREIPTSEINRLSTEYPGIALIGAAAEVEYRAANQKPASQEEKVKIAKQADKLATTAIRDFLENKPQAEDKVENDDDAMGSGLSYMDAGHERHLSTVEGIRSSKEVGQSISAPREEMAMRVALLDREPSLDAEPSKEVRKPIKSELSGEDEFIVIKVDGREITMKSVEFKAGKEYKYEYDDRGREISCETYEMVDGKRVLTHSKETVYGTKRNSMGKFYRYHEETPNARMMLEAGRFNGGIATIDTDYDTSDGTVTREVISGELVEYGRSRARQEVVTIKRDKKGNRAVSEHVYQDYKKVKQYGRRELRRSGGYELGTDMLPDATEIAYLLAENAAKGYKR